jgi:hypothetical protein
MRRVLMAMVFATGCGEGGSEDKKVAAYQSTVDDARALVTAHGQDVQAATTLDEVGALETTYQADWVDMHDRMQQRMDDVEGCGMDGDMSSMMDGATLAMSDLDDDVADHMNDHDAHTDVTQCHDAEAEHGGTMVDGLDRMESEGDGWLESGMMSCSMM